MRYLKRFNLFESNLKDFFYNADKFHDEQFTNTIMIFGDKVDLDVLNFTVEEWNEFNDKETKIFKIEDEFDGTGYYIKSIQKFTESEEKNISELYSHIRNNYGYFQEFVDYYNKAKELKLENLSEYLSYSLNRGGIRAKGVTFTHNNITWALVYNSTLEESMIFDVKNPDTWDTWDVDGSFRYYSLNKPTDIEKFLNGEIGITKF
jgi:hypothetical protein